MSKILLVEDELLWQRTLSEVLERESYEVVLAASYEEAKAYITAVDDTATSFDLVLLDLVLDEWGIELKGLELLPLIDELNNRARVKVIISIDQNHKDTFDAAHRALFEFKDFVFDTYDKHQDQDGEKILAIVQQSLKIRFEPHF